MVASSRLTPKSSFYWPTSYPSLRTVSRIELKSRIKGVRKIAEMPGYEAYRHDLHRLSDELLVYDELRHFMAHGFMRAEFDPAGNHRFELLRYAREGEGKYHLMQSTTDIFRLRNAVEDIGSYVNDVMNLFERIYRQKKLEPMPR